MRLILLLALINTIEDIFKDDIWRILNPLSPRSGSYPLGSGA
jgi:hypothetical protein